MLTSALNWSPAIASISSLWVKPSDAMNRPRPSSGA
jgi:hypothetical protein